MLETTTAGGGDNSGVLVKVITNDGFADPVTYYSEGESGDSTGIHFSQIPVTYAGGTWVAKVPVRKFSGSVSSSQTFPITGIDVGVVYDIQVTNCEIDAHSTVDTSNSPNYWDPTKPRFFSGTNCSARGKAVAIGSSPLSKVQLCINENGSDVSVKEYPRDFPGDTNTYTALNLSATFDSTHFVDGANIKITLNVWDQSGKFYTGSISAPAKNRAYVIANNTMIFFQPAADNANSSLSGMNQDPIEANSDDKHTIMSKLGPHSVFCAQTHGVQSGTFNAIWDCLMTDQGNINGQPTDVASHLIFGPNTTVQQNGKTQVVPNNIQVALQSKQSNLNLPPYLFVDLNACDSADDVYLIPPFLPLAGGPLDVAGLGWQGHIKVNPLLDGWVGNFYSRLAAGDNVCSAAAFASLWSPVDGSPDWSKIRFTTPTLFGESASKLHGVYGGKGLAWYLPQ